MRHGRTDGSWGTAEWGDIHRPLDVAPAKIMKIVKGIVIGKHDSRFNPFDLQNASLNRHDMTIAAGEPIDFSSAAADVYTLKVQGVDRKGRQLTKDFTVDEFKWNTTQIGDPWPLQGYPEGS